MEVFVPKTSGFCPGVKRAEEGVFKIKEQADRVNLHGPLIHNQNYSAMLESHHIKVIDIDTLAMGDTLVIRTHGISRYEELELAKKFTLKDLTCPIVKRVQKHIEKASQDKYFIIISGKEKHAEVQGLISYADDFIVIETQEGLDYFLENHRNIIPKNCTNIFIISQTTYSRSFFEKLCAVISQTITYIPTVIKDTICPITENKEQESLQLQQNTDFTVVIGDPHSSNSKKLYAILKEASDNIIFTQNLKHLQGQKSHWENIHKVLVVSSTSTPLFIEREIVEYLEKL